MKWSKHKNWFISARGLARAILSVFLELAGPDARKDDASSGDGLWGVLFKSSRVISRLDSGTPLTAKSIGRAKTGSAMWCAAMREVMALTSASSDISTDRGSTFDRVYFDSLLQQPTTKR